MFHLDRFPLNDFSLYVFWLYLVNAEYPIFQVFEKSLCGLYIIGGGKAWKKHSTYNDIILDWSKEQHVLTYLTY